MWLGCDMSRLTSFSAQRPSSLLSECVVMRPASEFSSDVLPDPDGPMMAVTLPLSNEPDTLFRIVCHGDRWLLHRCTTVVALRTRSWTSVNAMLIDRRGLNASALDAEWLSVSDIDGPATWNAPSLRSGISDPSIESLSF